jgi:hypothetical protein
MLEGFCFAAFFGLLYFSRGHTLHVFHLNKNNERKQHRNKTQMENMQSVTTWKIQQTKKAAKQNP